VPSSEFSHVTFIRVDLTSWADLLCEGSLCFDDECYSLNRRLNSFEMVPKVLEFENLN